MLRDKYIFETKSTGIKRKLMMTSFLFLCFLFCYVLFCFYIVLFARNKKIEATDYFVNKEPDLIVVLTGDQGRIAYALDKAQNNPSAKILISGISATNSLRTILIKQGVTTSVEEYLRHQAYQIELDYHSRTTFENALTIRRYLERENQNYKNILIISSDYHIMRIALIINLLMKDNDGDVVQNAEVPQFFYDSTNSPYDEFRLYKLLFKETIKIIQTIPYFVLWEKS